MIHTVYILYSEVVDKFYIGSTSDSIKERIRRHLSDHSGYTGRAKDWKLIYSESFTAKTDATRRELEIKSWKSKKRIEMLIRQSR